MDYKYNISSFFLLASLSLLLPFVYSEPSFSFRTKPLVGSSRLERRNDSSSLKFNSPESKNSTSTAKILPMWNSMLARGLIPVSNKPNETRKLFFWFWPAESKVGENDLTFWTNGGPGCSALEALLQENGPVSPDSIRALESRPRMLNESQSNCWSLIRQISWRLGQARPVRNLFSWTKASSMLYIEQPVGTGYSQGIVEAHNQTDISRDLFGFFQQWLKVFPEMKDKTFYLSGESYAGLYVPYLADYIYARQSELALQLRGIFILSPTVSYPVVSRQIPAWPLAQRYEPVFAFNTTFKAQLKKLHHECGYADYISKYDKFPPPAGPFAIPSVGTYKSGTTINQTCAIWNMMWKASMLVNPVLWDVLSGGGPDSSQLWPGQTGDPAYFNRTEVKSMLHVPLDSKWQECTDNDVMLGDDTSLPVTMSVLPGVIKKNKKTIIAHPRADFALLAQGTRMAIQNMTWNGAQGFQKPIENDFIVKGQGSLGQWTEERGLTYAEVELSGHMLPQYQPKAAYQLFQYLLGQADSPSA
ncbi:putative carboxypeptidase cpdS precursor [Melampsora larici-populina 98AG31]|uniref:Carboxypeptidase n=1 Tax=Melampsora larici-populina (strain 98AG31 / pathotype 3-4-7) TaxID=747676 RepID=F4S400_MELLP|nr:putative carboxypeptidase cpdS precursor [Melampsora larici-populina 98AG31]EGG00649.1 putative carboxypeptidase cpdS precursor [Melampsora larici-populina 98AG31]